MFFKRKPAPVAEPIDNRLIVARLDSMADRQEAIYEMLVRALKPISPVHDDLKGDG